MEIITAAATVALALTLAAACSSSSGKHSDAASDGNVHDTVAPLDTATGPARVDMSRLDCSKVAGTPVPASLDDVDCTTRGASSVATNDYPCGDGKFYWLSAEASDGTDLSPYVGRPGSTWLKVSTDASVTEMSAALHC